MNGAVRTNERLKIKRYILFKGHLPAHSGCTQRYPQGVYDSKASFILLFFTDGDGSFKNPVSRGISRDPFTGDFETGTGVVDTGLSCIDVYFPAAFIPNNDGKNDGFGPRAARGQRPFSG